MTRSQAILHDALQQAENEGYKRAVAAQSAHCVAVIEDLERKAMAETQRVAGVIVAAERERCAKIAEDMSDPCPLDASYTFGWERACEDVAAKIRSGERA